MLNITGYYGQIIGTRMGGLMIYMKGLVRAALLQRLAETQRSTAYMYSMVLPRRRTVWFWALESLFGP